MPGSSDKFNKGDYVCIGNVDYIKEDVLGIEGTTAFDADSITKNHLAKLSAYIRCEEELPIHRFRGRAGINTQPVGTLTKGDKTVFVEQKSMFGKSGYKAASILKETEFKKQFTKNGNEIEFKCVPDAGGVVPGAGVGLATPASPAYKITMTNNGVETIFYADKESSSPAELLQKIRNKGVTIYDKLDSSSKLNDQQITSLLESVLSNPSTSLQPTRCLPCIRNRGRRTTP